MMFISKNHHAFIVSEITACLKIKKGSDRRINAGCPWVYSNEIENNSALSSVANGSLVKIVNCSGIFLGIGYYNRHSLIAARILSTKENINIDEKFFVKKISTALNLRDSFFKSPFYRLIHSEADGLPGLVADRFDNIFVLQITTFGMENLLPDIIAALNSLFSNIKIILRNDVPARKLEGLQEYVKVAQGEINGENILIENDLKFHFDPIAGQKTGWFFDQRQNHQFISEIAAGKDVLDCYCYNGGFGINALKGGAKSVTFIDSSEAAIDTLKKNIALNSLNNSNNNVEYIHGKVFDELENLSKIHKKYQLIVLDPPAFIKSKKDFFAGIKGYEKLSRIAANLAAENGYLFIASCSHNASLEDLITASATGIRKAGKNSKIIRTFGAGVDHPIHPFLKESEYLKSILFQIT